MTERVEQLRQLLQWHKKVKPHSIFDPLNTQENLVALAESFFLCLFYFAVTIMVLHLLTLTGFLARETLLWLIIENLNGLLMKGLRPDLIENKLFVSFVIILCLGLISIIRLSFEIMKARLHPGSGKIKYLTHRPLKRIN